MLDLIYISEIEKALVNKVDKDKIADSLSKMKLIFEKSIFAPQTNLVLDNMGSIITS